MIKMIKDLKNEIKTLKESCHVQTEFGGFAGDDDPIVLAKSTLATIYICLIIAFLGVLSAIRIML